MEKIIAEIHHIIKDSSHVLDAETTLQAYFEYCEQIEPPVRMIEPASAINRATQCNRESH